MNVYDFDHTIYDGDSTIDFYLFCIKKNPYLVLRYGFTQCYGVLLFLLKRIDTRRMKEHFFCFLPSIKNLDSLVYDFWNQNENKIEPWYLSQRKENDVIITASPHFLIEEICKRKNISNLIATDLDTKKVKINGENCKGEEKVKCFLNRFKEESIECFYSDSLSDTPLAKISQRAFLIKEGTIIPWPSKKQNGKGI